MIAKTTLLISSSDIFVPDGKQSPLWNKSSDVLLVYDTSATEFKKIQKSNIATTLTYNTRTATGDGSTTAFTVTSGATVDDVIVTENGVVQAPTSDYGISGTTLTFTTAPGAGVAIVIRELP